MAEHERRAPVSADPATPPAKDGARRAYAPPRILSREPLEVMAATCTRPLGKAPGVCSTGRS